MQDGMGSKQRSKRKVRQLRSRLALKTVQIPNNRKNQTFVGGPGEGRDSHRPVLRLVPVSFLSTSFFSALHSVSLPSDTDLRQKLGGLIPALGMWSGCVTQTGEI